jgi:methionine-rich copper-binding protein CopC
MRIRMPLLVFACASVLAPPVGAHAFLDHALPAVGSTVHAPPPQVQLWFSQKLEPAFSTAQVLDSTGKRVDRADARVDDGDSTVLTVSLPELAPGRYRVKWRVLSVDTHVTEGDYSFDVVR